jgi:FMN-dependent NADH-azoreductase
MAACLSGSSYTEDAFWTDVKREIMWLQPIFTFLGYENIEKVTITYEDNLPAINLAIN